jgi:hypothetical protein
MAVFTYPVMSFLMSIFLHLPPFGLMLVLDFKLKYCFYLLTHLHLPIMRGSILMIQQVAPLVPVTNVPQVTEASAQIGVQSDAPNLANDAPQHDFVEDSHAENASTDSEDDSLQTPKQSSSASSLDRTPASRVVPCHSAPATSPGASSLADSPPGSPARVASPMQALTGSPPPDNYDALGSSTSASPSAATLGSSTSPHGDPPGFSVPAASSTAGAASAPLSPLRTHGQRGIKTPKVYTDGTVRYGLLTSTGEPRNFSEAFSNQTWKNAMTEEYDALMANNTWHLVPSTPNKNLIDCKWFIASRSGLMVLLIDIRLV